MLIDFNDVTISFADKPVLSQISFQVDANEFVYLVGRVGSGKSALLQTFFGETVIVRGSAKVLDFEMSNLPRKEVPELRRKIGMIFQDFRLLSHLTVRQNLDFVLSATDWLKTERIVRIEEVLLQVGMSEKATKYPYELSGGEQQRIAIARAMLNHPQLILADEPMGHLDSETAQEIMSLLYTLAQKGTTIVMATHNLSFLQQYPGRLLHCKDGKLREA